MLLMDQRKSQATVFELQKLQSDCALCSVPSWDSWVLTLKTFCKYWCINESVISTTVTALLNARIFFFTKLLDLTKSTTNFLWIVSALGREVQVCYFCLALVSFLNYKHFVVIIIFTFKLHCYGIMRNLFPQIAQNHPTLLPSITFMSSDQAK